MMLKISLVTSLRTQHELDQSRELIIPNGLWWQHGKMLKNIYEDIDLLKAMIN
jgi:hypothetical protein